MCTYDKQLAEVAAFEAAYYDDELQPPCTIAEFKELQARTKLLLGAELPKEYEQFLLKHNGLDFNGMVIYAGTKKPSEGDDDYCILDFVEANLIRRDIEEMNDFLLIGEKDDEEFGLQVSSSKYVQIDATCLDVIEEYSSFDEMIAEVIQSRL